MSTFAYILVTRGLYMTIRAIFAYNRVKSAATDYNYKLVDFSFLIKYWEILEVYFRNGFVQSLLLHALAFLWVCETMIS